MAKFLIVDDSEIFRRKLTKIVTNLGHKVIGHAEDGNIGFERYKELKPDIVLMDITMPKVDGLKGVQMIKEFDRQAKIVMCSAMGQKELVLKAIKAGAKDFIIKPFDEKRVVESVNRVVN